MAYFPNLPQLQYNEQYTKLYVTQFGGINRLSLGIEGAMYDALNMSAIHSPSLSTRLGFAAVAMKDSDGNDIAIDENIFAMTNLNGYGLALIGESKMWYYSYKNSAWSTHNFGITIDEKQNVLTYTRDVKYQDTEDDEITIRYNTFLFMPSMIAFVAFGKVEEGDMIEERISVGQFPKGDKNTAVIAGMKYIFKYTEANTPGTIYKRSVTAEVIKVEDGYVYIKGKLPSVGTDNGYLRFKIINATPSDGAVQYSDTLSGNYTTAYFPYATGGSYFFVGYATNKPIVELDNALIHANRVWGYKGRTILASSLGAGFDFTVTGTDAGGWSVETLLQEDITAATSFGGHPVFFTENHIITIYGDYPSDFALTTYDAPGVAEESTQSLAKCGANLYYLSEAGVMRYSGGLPNKISDPLTIDALTDGVAAADPENYYLWAKTLKDNGQLYVFNIPTQTWHKMQYGGGIAGQSARDTALLSNPSMAYVSNMSPSVNIVMLYDGGTKKLYCVPYQRNQSLFPGAENEHYGYEGYNHSNVWAVRLGRFFAQSPNIKGVRLIQLRARLVCEPTEADTGKYKSELKVKICYDDNDATGAPRGISDGTGFELIHTETVDSTMADNEKYKLRNIVVPIIPRRFDNFKLELSGTGRWEISSLAIEYYISTERR